MEDISSKKQFDSILDVIREHKELSVIFTKANADMDGRIINQMIDDFVFVHKERCAVYTSLGQLRYLSALQFCKAVVGNSSSGIIEVPSFGIPTVNIGERQRRRLHAASVINCGNNKNEIETALMEALSDEFADEVAQVKNPYEGEHTSDKMMAIMSQALRQGINKQKIFYDLKVIN